MNKNLINALGSQEKDPIEEELVSHRLTKTSTHAYANNFSDVIHYFYRDVKAKISLNSFGYDHPSDLYDDKDLESIKEFLKISTADSDDSSSSSVSEDKWDFIDDIREKFKENFTEKVADFDIMSLDSLNHVYETYTTKINPETKITKEEMAKALVNSPILGSELTDLGYFDYSG